MTKPVYTREQLIQAAMRLREQERWEEAAEMTRALRELVAAEDAADSSETGTLTP